MTREEAREAIKEAYGNSEYTDEIIKAIEQEPFMNKTCVSSKVCEHDKGVVLDKIRADIKKSSHGKWYIGRLDGKTEEVLLLDEVLQIIDKYKAESEVKANGNEK